MKSFRVNTFVCSLIALVAGLIIANVSHAESLRCNNKLVSPGASLYEVKTRCGEPDDAIHRTEIRTVTHEVSEPCVNPQQLKKCSKSVETSVEVVIDEWTYDFGITHFIRYLRFEDGRLIHITDGDYGNKSD